MYILPFYSVAVIINPLEIVKFSVYRIQGLTGNE